MAFQKTITKEVTLKGIGLHAGNSVEVKFKPAPVASGINFIRTDLPGRPRILACAGNVIAQTLSPRRTSIGQEGIEVQTIEHIIAALAGLAIDNIDVEISGEEAPGLDGSATPFIEIIKEAQIVEQDSARQYFQVREPLWVEDKDSSLMVLPASDFRISYTLSYDHPLLKAQFLDIKVNEETFEKEIAPSRTFCLEREVDSLRNEGLGKGANYDNTLVVGEKGVIDNKLRFSDEFTRHKILDLIGDLYLLGLPLKGHVIALKSGHPLNIKLLRKIAQQKERLSLGGVKAGYAFIDGRQFDVRTIMDILPHRYPFLLVDRILELEAGKRAVGIKNVTINENFFSGHFPTRPVMPGVLILEAMAQVAGVLMLSQKENQGKLAYFMAIDKVKFRKTVVPGDQLVLEVDVVRLKSKTGQVHTQAKVEGKVVAEANLMFSLVEE